MARNACPNIQLVAGADDRAFVVGVKSWRVAQGHRREADTSCLDWREELRFILRPSMAVHVNEVIRKERAKSGRVARHQSLPPLLLRLANIRVGRRLAGRHRRQHSDTTSENNLTNS